MSYRSNDNVCLNEARNVLNSWLMRTHQQIVREFGASALGRALRERGVKLRDSTPQRWADRDSIPGGYWNVLHELGVASLAELAEAAQCAISHGRAA